MYIEHLEQMPTSAVVNVIQAVQYNRRMEALRTMAIENCEECFSCCEYPTRNENFNDEGKEHRGRRNMQCIFDFGQQAGVESLHQVMLEQPTEISPTLL